MGNLKIIEMTLDDLEQIKDILEPNFNCNWSYVLFRNELENGISTTLVAKDNENIIGFGCIRILFEEAHLTNVGVDINYRKKGIGSKILGELIKIAKKNNAEYMDLELRVSNVEAKKLYLKFGFEVVGLRKQYYNMGDRLEDAVIMSLRLY